MAFGIALGAAIGGNPRSGFFGFIKEWSTLLGSAVAVFAAWIALANSMRQISTTIEIKQGELYRENQAARAALNLALSNICDYAENSIIYIESRRHGNDTSLQAPKFDENLIQILERNIRYSTDSHVNILAKLTSDIQVQIARFKHHVREDDFDNEIHADEAIYDALELYMQASNIFNYARFHEKSTHVITLHSALRHNRRFIRNPDKIMNIIIRRIGEEIRPAAG